LMEKYAKPVFACDGEDASAMSRWAASLERQAWVSAVSVAGTAVRITVSDVVRARRELLASAVAQDLILRRYEEARPSLEEVFLQLVETEAAQ
jgi:ABC-2 type transport system ATP-binding protein